jgi:nucleoside phosphorylase
VTLENLVKKPEIRKRLPAKISFPVCDMETFVLARAASQRGIPFFAARSISDTSDHEIPPELLDIFDESGKILYFRLSKSVLYKPGLVMEMVRLRRNSEMAARSLGSLVRALLDIGAKQPV